MLVVTPLRGFSNRPQTPNSRPSSADSASGPQFHVAVSGLKGRENCFSQQKLQYPIIESNFSVSAGELADLRNFNPGVDKDNYTITFPQHPCVILNALEVLGFR